MSYSDKYGVSEKWGVQVAFGHRPQGGEAVSPEAVWASQHFRGREEPAWGDGPDLFAHQPRRRCDGRSTRSGD